MVIKTGVGAHLLHGALPCHYPPTPEQRIKELEAQLHKAEQRVAEAEQKADFFKAVVDVLEKDYGVSLAKKPPGKSSRKPA